MRAQAGVAVHFVDRPELCGYVSARLPAGMVGVITEQGYHLTTEDRLVVEGQHPQQWDRHEYVRTFGL